MLSFLDTGAFLSIFDEEAPFTTTKSIIVEILLWAVAYVAFSSVAPSPIKNFFKRHAFWDKAKFRKGSMTPDAQSEMVHCATVAIHHFTAGFLMALGMYFNMPQLWRHGYLIEVGFEVADLVAMKAKLYPYHNDTFKQEIKYACIFHHIPGISLSWFIFESGLNLNPHLQTIAAWLLLAGSFTLSVQAYVHTLDFDKNMVNAALANMANFAFFLYARFYLFPKDAFSLLLDIWAPENGLSSHPARHLLYLGGLFLTLFNLVVFVEVGAKVIRYNQKAWSHIMKGFDQQKTIISENTGSIILPSSEKNGCNGRRRSSFTAELATVLQQKGGRRRSSIQRTLLRADSSTFVALAAGLATKKVA